MDKRRIQNVIYQDDGNFKIERPDKCNYTLFKWETDDWRFVGYFSRLYKLFRRIHTMKMDLDIEHVLAGRLTIEVLQENIISLMDRFDEIYKAIKTKEDA